MPMGRVYDSRKQCFFVWFWFGWKRYQLKCQSPVFGLIGFTWVRFVDGTLNDPSRLQIQLSSLKLTPEPQNLKGARSYKVSECVAASTVLRGRTVHESRQCSRKRTKRISLMDSISYTEDPGRSTGPPSSAQLHRVTWSSSAVGL